MEATLSIILLLAACLNVSAVPRFLGSSANETHEWSSNEARDFNPWAADLIEAADASDPQTYQLRHTLTMGGTRYAILTKVKEDGSLEHQAAKASKSSLESKPLDRQPDDYSSTVSPLAEASKQLLIKELGDGIQYMGEEASLNETRRGTVYDCAFKVWNDSSTADNDKVVYRVLPCRPSGRHNLASDDNEEYMTCKFTMDQTLRQAVLQKAELYLPWLNNNKPPPNARSTTQMNLTGHDDAERKPHGEIQRRRLQILEQSYGRSQ
ncbi:Hypp498 [Branchiostoma lanceolatum]|uniref:Hypp498 protein n=1 Tax=Branchiostoma lanceolatum TaxID=7740 RepID=A0A8J9VVA6_BRALA|nr:Hypp498 [Branchiostoma lanceolatum]